MKKILIVEDEVLLLNTLASQLSGAEFEVTTATDGKAGLEAALKERPDLILLDLLMPIMDGLTMLAKLREDTWGKTAVVFILTNFSTDERLEKAKQLGTEQYLVKSDLKLSEIVDKVKKRMGK
ncbi:response regulator [Candidatus Uhrbacteria bacterium]|nr:response regulator [Candidatus Uhrbacteria bacterium]